MKNKVIILVIFIGIFVGLYFYEQHLMEEKKNLNQSKIQSEKIVDTQSPIISCNTEIEIEEGQEIDLLKDVVVQDNSGEEIIAKVEGNYDVTSIGTYNLLYVAKDSSGNETKTPLILNVVPKYSIEEDLGIKMTGEYYIIINKTQNVVMVYKKSDKEYDLIKTFVCSTGKPTPLGTFKTSKGYAWGSVVGGVYARYSTRIKDSILFHSVPYFTQNKNVLEYEEYNKLGTIASAGCVRLTVQDSKWIFDNIPAGTSVYIYKSDVLPKNIEKPEVPKIDVNDVQKRGWDPTDDDPNNPWIQ